MKKKILSLVMLASAAAPLAAVVSCGGGVKTSNHSKSGVHNTTQQNTNTQTTGTTSDGSQTSGTGTSTGTLSTGTGTGVTTPAAGTSGTGTLTSGSGIVDPILSTGTLTSGDIDSATSTLTTGFNSIISGLSNVGTSPAGSSSAGSGSLTGSGTTITGSTGSSGSGTSGVGTPPPSSGTSGTLTSGSGSGSSGTPAPAPLIAQPPSENIALGSIADYEANGHTAQVAARNFQPTTSAAYNIMSHYKVPFAGKTPAGFMVKASDLDSSSFMVT